MNNGANRPIFAFDIDGTIGDYHSHFIKFAEGWLGRPLRPAEVVNDGRPLWEHLSIPHHVYREIKLAYRQGGMKRTMPAYPWASWLTQQLREEGAEVWLCTTRPFMRLDNVEPDTVEWLRRNRIEYDALICDTLEGKYTKYHELARQAGERVIVIMDDLPDALLPVRELVDQMPSLQRILLRDQPYNRTFLAHVNGWTRVSDSDGILNYCMIAFDRWSSEQKMKKARQS